MARIELSQPTLNKIHEAIKAGEFKTTDGHLKIFIDYARKNVMLVSTKKYLQGTYLECDAHSRRLIFKYFI